MTVFAYTRVSTDRQANEGESLDVQERTVAGYAMMHGLTIDRIFRERGVSGSKPLADRPEGDRNADLHLGLGHGREAGYVDAD
jgi:DNA invertase Pin-like site-specific DNA recombinase